MNSDTDNPTRPPRLRSRRNDTSVTPAIGDKISGGLISTSRILKGLVKLRFFVFLVVALLGSLGSRGLFEFQQRLDARAIRIGDLDERFVAQVLQVILAILLLPFTQHRFRHATVVERRRITF